jgi:hypothetical protein
VIRNPGSAFTIASSTPTTTPNVKKHPLCFICPPGFRIPDYNTIPKTKNNILILSPTPFYFYSFAPFPYLFHPSYLPSVFILYFFPFLSLPVSHFPASAPHVFDRLSFLAAHPAPFFFFRPIPVLSLSLYSHI